MQLHQRFEAQAAQRPEAIAIGCGTAALTYRQLNARANQLARALRAHDVGREEIVAIALERSPWTIVSMLAILKAGAAYLPLDPSHPLERSRFMVADAAARLVLRSAAPRFTDLAGPERCLDLDALDLEQYASDNLWGSGQPDHLSHTGQPDHRSHTGQLEHRSHTGQLEDLGGPGHSDELAYVTYTSGSTGRPKGVLITQRGIDNLCSAPELAIYRDDVVAQIANIAFDGAAFEIWGALLNGARLEIIAHETVLAPAAFAAALRDRAVSVVLLTSALLRHVSREVPTAFATLRWLLTGGEVVDPAAVRAIFAHGPPRRLINAYGPSEATTIATTFEIAAPPQGSIPIGRAIANVSAVILDADGDPVPAGVRGELHIGGLGLARGYLNDPDLTARKFIHNALGADAAARLYATGDMARRRADGNLEFLGRRDRQVKIRGFRVELDEIETALKALPDVSDAVVTQAEDDGGEKRIVAYVVASASEERDVAQWRALLAEQVPAHVLPDHVVALPAIPLNPNGKIDADALAAAFARARARAAGPHDEPQSPAERSVAEIFTAVLGVARIDPRANFFAVGGHSLLAAQVIARIGEQFAVAFSLRDFLAGPTIADVARRIASAPPRIARPIRPPAAAAHFSDAEVDAMLAEATRD